MKQAYDFNEYFVYLVLFTFIWVWAGCGNVEQEGLSEQSGTANGYIVDEFSALMNAHRESVGCKALLPLDNLNEVASEHSEDMVVNKYFSHIDLKKRTPFDRISLAQISFSAAGENIAVSGGDAASVLNMWLGSSGHRANIENCNYTHHGVGVAAQATSSQNYWTHVFIRQ